MTNHIDVFFNDWARGVHRRVARAQLTPDERLHLEIIGEEHYRDVILRPILIRDAEGVPCGYLHFDREPVAFYKMLPESLGGSYIGTTQIHNGNCPFARSNEVPFRQIDSEDAEGRGIKSDGV